MADLTAFQRDLLVVLEGVGSSDGAGLRRELERTRYSSVLPGQLYHNLDLLVDRSLVDKRDADGRTNRYSLTPAGDRAVRDLREWQQQYVAVPAE